MDGVYFVRASADGPFVKSLEPGTFSYCLMVRTGRLRLVTDFPVHHAFDLAAGDAVALSGLCPHMFHASNGSPGKPAGYFPRRAMTDVGLSAEVDLILGVAPNEGLALGSLMVGPIVVRPAEHPDLARRLWRAVEMLEDEYADGSWIDRNLVIRRLAEIMLVNMSRRVFADHGKDAADGSRVPANRQLMQAISAFFAAPQANWTLEEMARAAGMSRTRFAEQFRLVTGQTPGRIISRMRLTAVARRLVADAVSVEVAADEAGYSSSAAFVRAFQRQFGETPARWRRQRGGHPPGPSVWVAPQTTRRPRGRTRETPQGVTP